LPIPLLINKIKKITIINIPTPKIMSNTYSLSIIPSTKGLTLGKIIRVNTYANSHFEAAIKLRIKPLLEHLIKESIVKTIYIKSKLEIFSKNFKKSSIKKIYLPPKGRNTCNNAGSRVNTDIIANNIAIPVNIPKYIVGIKLDKTKIENPKTIVIDVFNIATPTEE
tara:strand:- start:88 stop:585 length:498 start_codon:yes stop_codon:yes gene_type:complete